MPNPLNEDVVIYQQEPLGQKLNTAYRSFAVNNKNYDAREWNWSSC